ncbi:MAG: DUF6434 domain-containing protein [Pseudomonadota bacterium]
MQHYDDDWIHRSLSLDTVITESITFGPNVRGFFKEAIGKKFRCTSAFIGWVRGNAGATFGDAVDAWHALEGEKSLPGYQPRIAECNNYLRYLRDFRQRFEVSG